MAQITASKSFEVEDGTRLTAAIKAQGIDILHRCGGNAKCTTCKVTFNSGEPETMTAAEQAKLEENDAVGDYRLSCQILCTAEMDVNVLMTMSSTGLDDAGPELAAEIPA